MKINLKKSKDTPYPIRQIENLRDLIDSSGAIFYCEKNIFLSIILMNAPAEYLFQYTREPVLFFVKDLSIL